MEKILVTGAGGFIASHLAEECVRQGYSVRALVRYNSSNNWGWLEKSPLKNELEIVAGDVRDYDSVYSVVQGCTAVFHLAALIGIPYSYVSPLAYVRTNIEGTYNVLQACLKMSVANVLVTSTSETYGTAQFLPINEKHPLVGQSPYAASKIAADQLAISYYRAFGLPVKIVRPFNTYGPRQSTRAVIPSIITQILSGKRELSIGNVSPTRDLTFVKDTVKAFLAIYRCNVLWGEVTNVGRNEEVSIRQLVELVAELLSAEYSLVQEEARMRPEKSEVERLRCDNGKILERTTWKPEYDLRKGLSETIAFFRNSIDRYKVDRYCI